MRKRGVISERLYKKILEVIPIPCVDVVLVCRGKFLLGKRNNKPARGTWWFVGGRIFKGERLEEAACRKIKEETGLTNIKIKKLLTARETIFRNSAQGPSSHTVNCVFLVEVSTNLLDRDNEQNSKLEWFSRVNSRWPKYVKDMLGLAGFK